MMERRIILTHNKIQNDSFSLSVSHKCETELLQTGAVISDKNGFGISSIFSKISALRIRGGFILPTHKAHPFRWAKINMIRPPKIPGWAKI